MRLAPVTAVVVVGAAVTLTPVAMADAAANQVPTVTLTGASCRPDRQSVLMRFDDDRTHGYAVRAHIYRNSDPALVTAQIIAAPAWEPRGRSLELRPAAGARGVAKLLIRLTDEDGGSTFFPVNYRVGYTGMTGDADTDVIVGNASANTLRGLGGADVLCGLGGHDQIQGGEGNDLAYGGDGHDSVDGGTGNDIVSGDRDSDRVIGGDGDDRLFGGTGGVENDIEMGGPGRDTIVDPAGEDSVTGGPDPDTFVVSRQARVVDGAAEDTVAVIPVP
ncbi:hypothetical protein GCM10010124_04210 [Pilimelia terevasa]|uniref:Calcium-binding protein n=1 Tax=Pilimelia terevasa TaxID=53372 RepID=A0A8J3BJ47_9ACTN|nr:calcium-binding protein [Pilimelia terevasa]GGK14770.1 hypothetical protein GCM10010124_04210 [Pilimelia terevasa]